MGVYSKGVFQNSVPNMFLCTILKQKHWNSLALIFLSVHLCISEICLSPSVSNKLTALKSNELEFL